MGEVTMMMMMNRYGMVYGTHVCRAGAFIRCGMVAELAVTGR